MQLRPYQTECVDAVLRGFSEFRRQLVVAPTGAGKTILFAHIAQRMQPKRTLILAHREELIDQAVDKIAKATGIFAQKEKAEHKASLMAPVVVGSVQTLQRRLAKWPQDHFGLVVADEAHHALADSWQQVLQHFTGANVLGVTATPDRGDKRNLGQYFESVAYEVSLFDLVKAGFLSRIRVKALPVEIDLKAVRKVAGDYSAEDLGTALEPYLRSIARALRDHASFRRALVFLPLIATSKAFAEICAGEGLKALHVDGNSEDRAERLARFARGEFDVLCNAMLLTEGYDDPSIDCVVVLRPTRSRALYAQMVGRGTRVAPGKEDLLVLDFLWLHEKHDLIRPAHLVAENEELAEAIEQKMEAQARGGGQDELDLEDLCNTARHEREEKLQAALAAQAKKRAKEMDAMELALSLHNISVAEYEPTFPWEKKPVSTGQAAMLARNGIALDSVKNRGHACAIIDMLMKRMHLGLATPKQLRLLRQFAHKSPETATFDEASAFLDERLKSRRMREAAYPFPAKEQHEPF